MASQRAAATLRASARRCEADGRDDDQRAFVLRTVQEREIRFVRLWFTDDEWPMGGAERIERGISVLPESLPGALAEMRDSQLVRGVLGEHLFDWFIANERAGWDEHWTYVRGLELEQNLPRL